MFKIRFRCRKQVTDGHRCKDAQSSGFVCNPTALMKQQVKFCSNCTARSVTNAVKAWVFCETRCRCILLCVLGAMNYLDYPIIFRNMKHLYGTQKKYLTHCGTCTSKLVNAITAVRLLLAPVVYELASRYALIAQNCAKRAVMEFVDRPTKNKVLNFSLPFLCRIILFHCQILSAVEAFVFLFSDTIFTLIARLQIPSQSVSFI